jgi:hypothetical protein
LIALTAASISEYGQQHAPRDRVNLACRGEKFDAEHARHPLVTDDHREGIAARLQLSDCIERLSTGIRTDDRIALAIPRPEIPTDRREYLRIIVDDEEYRFVHPRETTAASAG